MSSFWDLADRSGECWIWKGAKAGRGYGAIRRKDLPSQYAHRVAFFLSRGYLPAELEVCHHCDVPACIRPSHLFLGTRSDNALDSARKGRNPMQVNPTRFRGEANPFHRLTAAQVAEIRDRYALGGVRQVDLAAEFSVAQTTISGIVRGEAWRAA